MLIPRTFARWILVVLIATTASAGLAFERPKVVESFTAAAIVYVSAWGDLEGNIERIATAVDEAGRDGIKLAVFPEQATIGYIFDDFAMVKPYLDTIPGKTTEAVAAMTRKHKMYAVVGIAEIDPDSGLGYNSAALVGPDGYIGKYRKTGLNSQDQRWASPGNLGYPVFDTELGRLMLLICYDDTYWQYARMASLHGVDVITWISASDRVMPGTPKSKGKGDHSTVAGVQYLSFINGAWVVAATRSGIETNPLTQQKLYYNGGSSIWDPYGNKIAQAEVVRPVELKSGVHGRIVAEIKPAAGRAHQDGLLARRRPELYGLLSLHRAPWDPTATTTSENVALSAAQLETNAQATKFPHPPSNGLLVLPAYFRTGVPSNSGTPLAEDPGGPSEQELLKLAKAGHGWVVGSYVERDGNKCYHTVAMADPTGKIAARYRSTHLGESDRAWASVGDKWTVVSTPIGRIGLIVGEELAVPEVYGILSALRADIVAAPSGLPGGALLQIDPKLLTQPYPENTPFVSFSAAKLGQYWLVAGGWRDGNRTTAIIAGPEPIVATPPLVAFRNQRNVQTKVTVPWPGTWINQAQLIDGQQIPDTVPLSLDTNSPCFRKWQASQGWERVCW
jgi:predicted amidohydrolase